MEYSEEELGFPVSYLSPVQTPHGLAYPGPRIRVLFEDLENIQKRMAAVQVSAHPFRLQKVYPKKEAREAAYTKYKEEYEALQKEMKVSMDALGKFEATKEQFIPPMQKTPRYGNTGPEETRVEREHWAEQYKEAMAERSERMKAVVVENAKEEDDPTPPIGTFLQV